MLYFSNKQRSGAGGAKDTVINGRGKAVVTFQDNRSEPKQQAIYHDGTNELPIVMRPGSVGVDGYSSCIL